MDYFELIQRGIDVIEEGLLNELSVPMVARSAFCSEAYFSRIFHSIIGQTVKGYIQYRRLSLAGQELALGNCKIIDIAYKYHYSTPESFSKAFIRFHGVSPNQCKKNAHFRYYERAFPLLDRELLAKSKSKGEVYMTRFGSSLRDVIEELDRSSANLYFCFNVNGAPYAIHGLSVREILWVNEIFFTEDNKAYMTPRGFNIPMIRLDENIAFESLSYMKNNILVLCSSEPSFANATGIVIDGDPVLNICSEIKPYKGGNKPFIETCGVFDEGEIPIISFQSLREYYQDSITDSFDKKSGIKYTNTETSDNLSRLEHAAYNAEMLSRNASIEACRGMRHHKGTMVVAYELHALANELSSIAKNMRNNTQS